MHGPLVFGEVLFDCFPGGRRVLGGAPFNVAWALRGFGLDPLLVSGVGNDGDGRHILSRMERWGMSTEGVHIHPTLPTGTVDVHITDGDARYDIPMPRAWDAIDDAGHTARNVLYHGTLALRSETNRCTLRAMAARSDALRFFDVNLRPPHTPLDRVREWLPGAAWAKCNLEELRCLLGLDALSYEHSADAARRLRKEYGIGHVLVTAGGDGARAVGDAGSVDMVPEPDGRELVDTVGAGDAFSAVFIHGLITGQSLDATIRAAGRFARSVCTMRGATTDETSFYAQTKELP